MQSPAIVRASTSSHHSSIARSRSTDDAARQPASVPPLAGISIPPQPPLSARVRGPRSTGGRRPPGLHGARHVLSGSDPSIHSHPSAPVHVRPTSKWQMPHRSRASIRLPFLRPHRHGVAATPPPPVPPPPRLTGSRARHASPTRSHGTVVTPPGRQFRCSG